MTAKDMPSSNWIDTFAEARASRFGKSKINKSVRCRVGYALLYSLFIALYCYTLNGCCDTCTLTNFVDLFMCCCFLRLEIEV